VGWIQEQTTVVVVPTEALVGFLPIQLQRHEISYDSSTIVWNVG
jgi:hypothetical protein